MNNQAQVSLANKLGRFARSVIAIRTKDQAENVRTSITFLNEQVANFGMAAERCPVQR